MKKPTTIFIDKEYLAMIPRPSEQQRQTLKESIKKDGWKIIPELAQKDDRISTLKKYKDKPEEWFFDNQLIWTEFRKAHFRKI